MQTLAVRPIELSRMARPDFASVDRDGCGGRDRDPFSDFYIAKGQLVRRYQETWSSARAMVSDIYCESGLDFRLKFSGATIVMALEEVGGRVEVCPASVDMRKQAGQSGAAITLVPAGQEVTSRSATLRFVRLFTLEIDERQMFEGSGTPTYVFEPRLSKICKLLAQECRTPDANGCAYADSLVLALSMALSRFNASGERTYPKGGLAPWQLRRVQEFMIENMTSIVSNRTLADLAEISLTHFSREFKASVGCAPHQWMTDRRIERAKRLLLSGDISIAEISLALGFCDQAHFTRVFRKAVGDTPLIWQRTRRG